LEPALMKHTASRLIKTGRHWETNERAHW